MPAQTVPALAFDVVSIHPSPPAAEERLATIGYEELPDGLVLTGVKARVLVADAFGMDLPNILGGPSWIDSAKYDITAKFDHSLSAYLASLDARERVRQLLGMLRPALAERFKLQVRREIRQTPVYDLVVAKSGPKFAPVPKVSGTQYQNDVAAKFNGFEWTINHEPMGFVALQLSRNSEVGRNVIDKTGLPGEYKFIFTEKSPSDPELSIFTALEEQLGLKLKPSTGPVDVLVIDHIEPPSVN